MLKRISTAIVVMCVCLVTYAQSGASDSLATIFDDLKVPLVEKKYVANSNFQDNWYISLYGGVTSNWGSDDSHASFWRVMGPAAAIAVGKELTPISGFRMQINYVRNTGVTDNLFDAGTSESGETYDFSDLTHNRYKWNS